MRRSLFDAQPLVPTHPSSDVRSLSASSLGVSCFSCVMTSCFSSWPELRDKHLRLVCCRDVLAVFQEPFHFLEVCEVCVLYNCRKHVCLYRLSEYLVHVRWCLDVENCTAYGQTAYVGQDRSHHHHPANRCRVHRCRASCGMHLSRYCHRCWALLPREQCRRGRRRPCHPGSGGATRP